MDHLEDLERSLGTVRDCLVSVDVLIRDFITQAEACNFTDRLGHSLEMNTAYRALKASVGE